MLVISAAAIIAVSPTCSWDNPGANRYTGSVPAAVHHYTDIPKDIRDRLQVRMERREYDEVVDISKDNISGRNDYINLRDMHFGSNRVCQTVTREKWKPLAKERGLIYCESEHCIIVPTVCGNVSRVTKVKTFPKSDTPSAGGGSIPNIPFSPMLFPRETTFETLKIPDSSPVPETTTVPDEPIGWFPPIGTPIPDGPGSGCCRVISPPIPEPSTLLLFLAGIIGIITFQRFKKSFRIAEYFEVSDASLEDGILTVRFTKNAPAETKPKLIAIK